MASPTPPNPLTTGTTTVAVVCKGGVVLGADTRVTSGYLIAHKRGRKIFRITPRTAVTVAGVLADAQAIVDSLRFNARLYQLRYAKPMSVRAIAHLLSNLLFSYRLTPLITEFIVGGFDIAPSLYRVDLFGSITAEKYISSGSGSPTALGVLESEYRSDMDLESATRLVVKSLMASLSRDAATGNWIDVVTISEDGVTEYTDEEKQILIDGVWNSRGR